MKRLSLWRQAGIELAAVILGQMLAIAVIPTLIFQPLHITFYQQRLPVGLIVGVYSLTTMICGLFFGRVTDQHGPKKVLLVSMLPLTGVYLLYPFADELWEIIGVRVINGVLFSLVLNALIVLVRQQVLATDQVFQARIHGIILSLNFAGSGIAMYCGLQLVNNPILLWSSTAILSGIAVVLVYWTIMTVASSRLGWRGLVNKLLSHILSYAKGVIEKNALLASLPDVGVSSAYWAFLTYFALYVGESAGVILFLSTVVIGIAAISVMPKLVVNRSKLVIGGSILTLILSFILISRDRPFWVLLLIGIMVGVAMAGNNLGILERVNFTADRDRLGAANATAGLLKQLGGIIGPAYAGLMWSLVGADHMWISFLPLLLGSLAVLTFCGTPKPSIELYLEIQKEIISVYLYPPFPSDLDRYAREIIQIKQGYGIPLVKEGDQAKTLIFRVRNAFRVLGCLKAAAQGPPLNSPFDQTLEGKIQQVRTIILHLLQEIEKKDFRKSFNQSSLGSNVDWPEGVKGAACWDRILVILENKQSDRAAKTREEVECLLNVVQAMDLPGLELHEVFSFYDLEDRWSKALKAVS
jgi:MFS family permease